MATAAFAAARKSRRPEEIVSFAALAPVYALAHGAGMWKGPRSWLATALVARDDLRRSTGRQAS